MEAFILIPIAIVAAVVIRLVAGSMNHSRIRDYTHARGGRVTGITWEPFGPGWFGEKNSAIYRVDYVDKQGKRHVAYCKTSLLSGVYFTQDTIAGPASPGGTESRNMTSTELDRLAGQLARGAAEKSSQKAESAKQTTAAFDRLLNQEGRSLQPESPKSPETVSAELEQLAGLAIRDPKTKSLEEENRRLRQELEELKRKQSNENSGYLRDPR